MKNIIKAIRSGHPPTLFAAFLYFDLSFAIWVLIGALGIFVSKDLGLSASQKGLVVAVPLLGGSFFRILAGLLVDRFGPKKVGIIAMFITLIPLLWGWLGATSFYQLIGVGFFLGVAGASFTVALPLASHAYPSEHQGIAMGIAGAGNSGTVISVLLAPFLARAWGWHVVFGMAIPPLLITLIVFATRAREFGLKPVPRPMEEYTRLLKARDLWWFNLYYSVTFGGFVGLASFLSIFLHDQYHLPPVTAGGTTAVLVFAGSFIRPIGGLLSDRIGGLRLLEGLYLLAFLIFGAISFFPPIEIAIALIFIGMLTLGMGNGAIFQEVPQRFDDEIGIVSGFIGAAGGIGGFFLPTMLGKIKQWTGSYAFGFLSFGCLALACFISLVIRKRRRPKAVHISDRLDEGGEGRVQMEVVLGG